MPKYLLEVTYTLDGVKGLNAEGGSARVAAATELVESLGGKIESFYFAFGDTDVYVIVDMPDDVSVRDGGAHRERWGWGHGADGGTSHGGRP